MPISSSESSDDMSTNTLSISLEDLEAESVPPIAEREPSYDNDETAPEPPKRGLFSRLFSRKGSEDKPPKPVPAMPRGGVATAVAALYKRVGSFVKPFDPGCGTALIMGADDCGRAWEEVAKRNPAVRRWILALLATGANMELLVAHAPILAAVAIHHVPAVRQLVTETTEKMTAAFNEEMAKMRADDSAPQFIRPTGDPFPGFPKEDDK